MAHPTAGPLFASLAAQTMAPMADTLDTALAVDIAQGGGVDPAGPHRGIRWWVQPRDARPIPGAIPATNHRPDALSMRRIPENRNRTRLNAINAVRARGCQSCCDKNRDGPVSAHSLDHRPA